MKDKKPKVGQKIFVPSSFYLSHGVDDFAGGEATISKVIISKTLPEDNPNRIMVCIKERPSTSYNWKVLLQDQAALRKEYKGKKAHPDPDYSPSSNTWD